MKQIEVALFVSMVLVAEALGAASALSPEAMGGDPNGIGKSNIDFVAFENKSAFECTEQHSSVCRERRNESPGQINYLIDNGENLYRDGEELLFVYRADAGAVSLRGGLQYPLSRIIGTDMWVLRLHVADLDELVLSYAFAVDNAPPPNDLYFHWRGEAAPDGHKVADELDGLSEWISVDSTALSSSRRVYVYRSPTIGNEPVRFVVYFADGKYAREFARVIEPMVDERVLPRLLIVAVEAAEGGARNEEYVPALGAQSGRFDAYQEFVRRELVPLVERRYGVSVAPVCRSVAGFSNGADWAIATGLNNSNLFEHVIAFSAGWPLATDLDRTNVNVTFFLGAGTLDQRYYKNTKKIEAQLSAGGVHHAFADVVGGHDLAVWIQLFVPALSWSVSEGACFERKVPGES